MTGNWALVVVDRQQMEQAQRQGPKEHLKQQAVWCGFSCVGGGSEWQDELVKQAGSRSRRAL